VQRERVQRIGSKDLSRRPLFIFSFKLAVQRGTVRQRPSPSASWFVTRRSRA
jgi:hypothetical protein